LVHWGEKLKPLPCFLHENKPPSWAWWYMPAIPAFRRLSQVHEFYGSLSYIGDAASKNKQTKNCPCYKKKVNSNRY
jgi:hypothetical protein